MRLPLRHRRFCSFENAPPLSEVSHGNEPTTLHHELTSLQIDGYVHIVAAIFGLCGGSQASRTGLGMGALRVLRSARLAIVRSFRRSCGQMNVTVYTMHGCGACDRAKEFLARNGVKFTELNVSEDTRAREELLAMGYRAAPVIKVDNQTMLGFDADKLKQFLGLKG